MFALGAYISTNKNLQKKLLDIHILVPSCLYLLTYTIALEADLGTDNSINFLSFILLGWLVFKAAFTLPNLSESLLHKNDISYGIYIYHMPIVNFMIYKEMTASYTYLAIALLLSTAIGFLSWRLIEKPALRLKKLVYGVRKKSLYPLRSDCLQLTYPNLFLTSQTMNSTLPRLASMLATLVLIAGCSSKGEPKVAKVEPSRPAETVVQSISISQAKNNIMSACSAKRLQIHTSKDEVTCALMELSGPRKRDIERFINDEFATNVQIVTQFKLAEEGANVKVTANIYAQYLAPMSVLSGPQTRTRNLVDDFSFNEMSALLDQATHSAKSFK